MLTLVETKDAIPLLGIYATSKPGTSQSTRKKRTGTVFFTHDLDPDKQNVSDASGVLHLHKTALKKENHVNDYEFEEIAALLDEEQEPDMHHPLKHAYWNIRQHFDRYLRREMFIGDDPSTQFELNLSSKKSEWPGTMTLIGSSGAGKTRFLTDLMLRYLRGTPDHSKRQILWLSPELEIDKTIKLLRERRWAMWFRGVDISSQAVKKSGLSAAAYYQQHVADLVETSGEDALIVLDDFPDGAPGLYPCSRPTTTGSGSRDTGTRGFSVCSTRTRAGATRAACRATSTSCSSRGRNRTGASRFCATTS